jgi:hypothetical protein
MNLPIQYDRRLLGKESKHVRHGPHRVPADFPGKRPLPHDSDRLTQLGEKLA